MDIYNEPILVWDMNEEGGYTTLAELASIEPDQVQFMLTLNYDSFHEWLDWC